MINKTLFQIILSLNQTRASRFCLKQKDRRVGRLFLNTYFLLVTVILIGCGGQSSGGGTQLENPQIALLPSKASISPGERIAYSAAISNGSSGRKIVVPVEWHSSNPGVATVDGQGQVVAVAAGMTEITASVEGATASADLGVSPAASSKPPEIIFVLPVEGQSVSKASPCADCGLPQLGAMGANFGFSGQDVFESAQLFIDGTDVTPNASVQVIGDSIEDEGPTVCTSEGDCRTIPGEEGSILWPHLLELPTGSHEARVEAISRDGKSVSYAWEFQITD